MGDKGWAAVQRDGADAPRRPLAEVDVRACPYRCFDQQHADRRHILKWQHAPTSTAGTGVARRIRDEPAIGTDLQRKSPFRRSRGQSMRGAAAHTLRQ